MANFPIQYTEAIPSGRGPSVRANIDVRTGEETVGRAISGLGGAIADLGLRIRQKREEMTDAVSTVQAQKLRGTATIEFETFKLINPQETWEAERLRQAKEVGQEIAMLPFSDKQRAIQEAKSQAYSDTETAKALTDATRRLRTDTIDALTESLTAAFRSGDPKKIAEQIRLYKGNGANMGKDKIEVLSDIKAAKAVGEKLRSQDAISVVHAAIEAKNFGLAKELAKNPIIPEPQQTTLRNTIRAAEAAAKNEQKTLTEIYVEQAHKTAVTELVKDINSVTFINNLPEELQKFWQEKLDKRTTSLEKGEDTFNQYDPVLYNGLKQQIRETPDKVSYMDIIDSVGNGLTPTQASELFQLQDEMQRKDSPLAQSHIKRAHDRINDLQDEALTVKGIKPPTAKSTPEEVVTYYNVFDEMHEAIDRNADLKPTEMRKYTEEMVRPVAEEAGRDLWGMIRGALGWQPATYGFALGAAYMEREKLLRTRPVSEEDFQTKYKNLQAVDPDTASKYWDRWRKEIENP